MFLKGYVIGWLCGVFFTLLAIKYPGWAFAVAVTCATVILTVTACAWAYDRTHRTN